MWLEWLHPGNTLAATAVRDLSLFHHFEVFSFHSIDHLHLTLDINMSPYVVCGQGPFFRSTFRDAYSKFGTCLPDTLTDRSDENTLSGFLSICKWPLT